MKRTRSHERGFTLIEMMVVVAIVAILSAIVIAVKSSTNGANPQNTSMEMANFFNTCKMRAVSTRRWHRCEITNTSFTMEQWSATGLTTPSGSCTPPSTNCWQLVTETSFDIHVIAYMGQPTPYPTAGVATGVTLTATPFDIDFKPDGSSTGGTIFFADAQGAKPWRTIVYKATGSSYARSGW